MSRPPSRIVCAAIKNRGGSIICGPRHFDKIMYGQIGSNTDEWRTAEQGFVDQYGQFYDRTEAWIIANGQNQILHNFPCMPNTLFSEHLY